MFPGAVRLPKPAAPLETGLCPKTPDEDFHPLFVEALQKQDYVDYLLDVLLSPDMEERAAFIIDCGKEVSNLERRMAELAAGDTAGRRTDHARSTATPER